MRAAQSRAGTQAEMKKCHLLGSRGLFLARRAIPGKTLPRLRHGVKYALVMPQLRGGKNTRTASLDAMSAGSPSKAGQVRTGAPKRPLTERAYTPAQLRHYMPSNRREAAPARSCSLVSDGSRAYPDLSGN